LRWVKVAAAKARKKARYPIIEWKVCPMLRLAALLYAPIAPTMAGILVIAALATGNDTVVPIVVAAATGFLAAIPTAYLIARRIRPPRS